MFGLLFYENDEVESLYDTTKYNYKVGKETIQLSILICWFYV